MLKTIKKAFLQSEAFMLTLMALTAVGITATGIIYKQDFFKMIPLYVSLVVSPPLGENVLSLFKFEPSP